MIQKQFDSHVPVSNVILLLAFFVISIIVTGSSGNSPQNSIEKKTSKAFPVFAFDNYKIMKYLKDIGYDGPVGIQGYSIKGDPKENLSASINAWRKINEKLIKGVSE